MKRIKVSYLLLLCSLVGTLAACNNSKGTISNEKTPNITSEVNANENNSQEKPTERVKTEKEVENAQNRDTEVGLLTTKIDQNASLSEEQKTIIQYFDNDYFEVADYQFLQRYPQVFEGSQIHCVAQVSKILSATNEDYQALVFIFDSKSFGEYGALEPDYTIENYIIVNGKQQGLKRVIEGDVLQIYGRYSKLDTYTIDGTSFILPTFNL